MATDTYDVIVIGAGSTGENVADTWRVTGVKGGWLYPAGDLNRRTLLTHMGKYQARACGDVIVARAHGMQVDAPLAWSRYTATADHQTVPQVVFAEPQVGAVGLTEDQARHPGLNVKVVEYAIGHVAGAAVYADGYRGHAKMVVDESRRVVVGMTFVGSAVGELVHSATIAIVAEVPLDRLWHAVSDDQRGLAAATRRQWALAIGREVKAAPVRVAGPGFRGGVGGHRDLERVGE